MKFSRQENFMKFYISRYNVITTSFMTLCVTYKTVHQSDFYLNDAPFKKKFGCPYSFTPGLVPNRVTVFLLMIVYSIQSSWVNRDACCTDMPAYFCNNFVYCQPMFIIFGTYTLYTCSSKHQLFCSIFCDIFTGLNLRTLEI